MAPRLGDPQSLEIIEADRFENAPHPRRTNIFVGHAATELALRKLYSSDLLPHACLIGGPAGIGKATLAWRLARFILANPDPNTIVESSANGLDVPADHPIARQIAALAHPDLVLLRRIWNAKDQQLFNEIRVDDVRRAALMFRQAAGRDGFRICILDCAEDLNAESANALLKILEEPPPRSLFLIVSHKPDRVLPTIRSRCRKISLKPLAPAEIANIIDGLGSPWSDASAEERWAAITSSRGSVRESLRRLGHGETRTAALVSSTIADLPQLDWSKVHALADEVAGSDKAKDFDIFLVSVLDWLDREAGHASRAEQGKAIGTTMPYALAWEKASCMARRMSAFNLDRKPVVLALFAELAAIVHHENTAVDGPDTRNDN
jgi:DNA polymerase-3 subunit delta'